MRYKDYGRVTSCIGLVRRFDDKDTDEIHLRDFSSLEDGHILADKDEAIKIAKLILKIYGGTDTK